MDADTTLTAAREAVLARTDVAGVELTAALAEATDRWLTDLFERVVDDPKRVALVAVGGYGRGELCPGSDLDLVLVHERRRDIKKVADAVWYPLWDEGFKVGHSVRSLKETRRLLGDGDLDTATSLLDARLLAGDPGVHESLLDVARSHWTSSTARTLRQLGASVTERHREMDEVAFLLEPGLKEGRGGLRDVQALRWAAHAGVRLDPADAEWLQESYDTILAARAELHRVTGKARDVLLLQAQDAVADALGLADADVLMAGIASAARTIAYLSDTTWRQVLGDLPSIAPRPPSGVGVERGEVVLNADPATDPLLVLNAAVYAATNNAPIARRSLALLADRQPMLPDPWPEDARSHFVSLLEKGPSAIPVIESLDFFEVWSRLLPEWEPNRSRPQRNVYHRFTVDRHLLEAAAGTLRLRHTVSRPDLLILGALLHDIGKGYPGDHTEVGMRLIADITRRMGFPDDDVETLVRMCEHHLLLPDVATRRDIDDEQTIRLVAGAVRDVPFLELLAALTEADSRATGPTAWSDWKAELVRSLADRTEEQLRGTGSRVRGRSWVTEHHADLMGEGQLAIHGDGLALSVVAPDRAGLFSRVAGVLALQGLDVLQADALSTDAGMALAQFHVAPLEWDIDWTAIERQVGDALAGRLAIDARLADRARTYRRRQALAAHRDIGTEITFDTDSATDATILEVHTADRMGLLYHLTSVIADMELDIRYASVQTLSNEVIDSFYVTSSDGPRLGVEHQREVELAIRHALALVGDQGDLSLDRG